MAEDRQYFLDAGLDTSPAVIIKSAWTAPADRARVDLDARPGDTASTGTQASRAPASAGHHPTSARDHGRVERVGSGVLASVDRARALATPLHALPRSAVARVRRMFCHNEHSTD